MMRSFLRKFYVMLMIIINETHVLHAELGQSAIVCIEWAYVYALVVVT